MANPPPFPPTAYDSADWVRAVTPVTVTGGGGGVTQVAPITSFGGTVSSAYGATTTSIPLGWNDGSTHLITGAYLSMICLSYSGSSQVVVHSAIRAQAINEFFIDLFFGFQTFSSTGPLQQAQTSMSWPGGYYIPPVAVSTQSLFGEFFVLSGTGTFSVYTTFGFYYA